MIEIECHCGVGLARGSQSFTLSYDEEDFFGMTHEQIVGMVHQDAKRKAAQDHLEVWVDVPSFAAPATEEGAADETNAIA